MEFWIEKVKQHCVPLLSEPTEKIFTYHNLQHTLDVLTNVKILANYQNCTQAELEILQIAALFHDTGLLKKYMGHEEISANNAKSFLNEISYPEIKTHTVIQCILATKMPQNPTTDLERIICDADLYHLASRDYFTKNELLRKEWELNLNIVYTDDDWQHLNLNFLKNHHYFTTFGQIFLEHKKDRNTLVMKEHIN